MTTTAFEQQVIQDLNFILDVSDFRPESNYFRSDENGTVHYLVLDRANFAASCREVADANSNPEPSAEDIDARWDEEIHLDIDDQEYAVIPL